MRAVVQDAFGGPEVLHVADVPQPAPILTEVLVRVHAAGVNPVDWKTRAGRGAAAALGPLPFTIGWDVSGVVEQVGFGVTRFAPGDEVFGMPRFPRQAAAYADYVTAPSRQLARKPANLSHVEAAAIPLAALTGWQAIVETARIEPEQRILIHGAAGGVGHLAVQIAKSRGATVFGTAKAAQHDFLRGLGADELIDYTAARFEDEVADLDVVLDLIGGETSLRSVSTLRRGGLLIVVPSGADQSVLTEAERQGARATNIMVEPDYAALEQIAALAESGRLRVEIDAVFPLEEAAKAHEHGETRSSRGKIVLSVAPGEPTA
ncbi:MAG TPA: NADP-dependent oxidoreductase [Gaiellaceae bacterium]